MIYVVRVACLLYVVYAICIACILATWWARGNQELRILYKSGRCRSVAELSLLLYIGPSAQLAESVVYRKP